MTITLSEFTNKIGNFNKQIEINKTGEVKIDSAANVVSASAKTMTMGLDDVASYIDSLKKRYDTALVLGVWRDGIENWNEYDIEISGSEDPANGIIARTKKFFQYANNDSTSLMYLDFDGDHDEKTRNVFLSELDIILADSLIGELGHEREKICRWIRPSSSGSATIKGKTGTGLHVYLAVKNASEELIKLIHKFCWMQDYGRGYKLTAAGTILAESLIDPAVGSPERVVYSADMTCTGDGRDDHYDYISRDCEYVPGGIIDCEIAIQILRDITVDYDREWNLYKSRVEKSQEVIDARNTWKAAQIEKKIEAGFSKKEAKMAVKSLANGILLSNEMLLRNDGSEVRVSDIMCDPDTWLRVNKFCDPIKKEQHRNVGMILGTDEKMFLNSKSHGGVKYWFRWNYEDLADWVANCELDELEDWISIHISNAEISTIQSERLVKEAAALLNISVVVVRKEVKIQEEELRGMETEANAESDEAWLDQTATHGDIIEDYIRDAGDCRGYGDGLYIWNDGTTWEKHSIGFIQKELRHRYNHVLRCSRVSDYKALSVAITGDDSICVSEWNQEYGVPCSDGFYKVTEEGCVRTDYTKDLGCRFKLGFKPDFHMKTPLFDKLLENVEDEILYQQMLGLSITGYLHKMQKVFTMFGEGGAGKGTTNDIITAMFPSRQVTNVPLDKLNDERFLVPLVDSQVNIISEVSASKPIDLTGLKKASGGDGMSAWVLYQGQRFFTPTCSFVINMNNWIGLKQVGSDVKRRLGHSIVKFVKRQDKQIDGLAEQIIQHEMPGVLAWALDGVRTYFEYGLHDELSLGLYQQWTASVDPVSLFFDERCIFTPRRSVLRSELYKGLERFCEESNYYTPKKGVFFERLDAIREVGVERKTAGFKVEGMDLRQKYK